MELRRSLVNLLLVAIFFAFVVFLAFPSSDLSRTAECPKIVLPDPSISVKEEALHAAQLSTQAETDGTAEQVAPRPPSPPGQLPWADMLHASEPCLEGPISVAWVMKDRLAGSHLWSGWDICDGINGNHANGSKRFPDIVCLPLLTAELKSKSNEQVLDLFRKEGQPPEKQNVDLCVFLKGAERGSIGRCRELGARTAMMYVDAHPNMLNEGGIHDYVLPDFDHVVVPNTLMSQHYAQVLGGSRVWVIPQQNPNVHRVVKTNAADPVRVVAWQGSPENRMSAEVRDAITAWTSRNPGIEFREIFFRAPGQTRADQERARDQAFKDVVSQADVLVIFPPQTKFMALEVYKPSGRNLFSLSMGIPSILLPYVSYTEDNKWGANYPAFASNIPQLLRWLDILRDSAEARVTLSRMALEWADHFSMDHIALRWAYHIRSAACGQQTAPSALPPVARSDPSPALRSDPSPALRSDHSPASRTAMSWLSHLATHFLS